MADSIKIRINGDDSGFKNTLSGIGKSAGSMFKSMLGVQAVTKGFSMLTGFMKESISTGM